MGRLEPKRGRGLGGARVWLGCGCVLLMMAGGCVGPGLEPPFGGDNEAGDSSPTDLQAPDGNTGTGQTAGRPAEDEGDSAASGMDGMGDDSPTILPSTDAAIDDADAGTDTGSGALDAGI